MSDSDSREEFEKWCVDRSVPFAKVCEWYFEIWQAAYAAGVAAERERAARVCDDMVLYTGYDCAAAIRRGE